jgi:uncharacterized membrane protein
MTPASDSPTIPLVLGKGRIESLTDGIFATVMTVLVLSLSIPTIVTTSNLEPYLHGLSTTVLSYVLSFLILAVFWVRHHIMFHFVDRVDNRFLWLNISLLLSIGFVPFSTELIGRFPFDAISTVIYGANMFATGVCMQGIWSYSTSKKLLSNERLFERGMVTSVNRTLTGGPLLYLAGILISLIPRIDGPHIAVGLYISALVFYVLASTFNRGPFRLRRRHKSGLSSTLKDEKDPSSTDNGT